eukprot:Gb_32903 [translate_table: standard]
MNNLFGRNLAHSSRQLKVEIANLSQIIEQGTGLSMGQEKELNDLMKQKEEVCKERDTQLTYIVQLRKEIGDLNDRVKLLEDQKSALEHDVGSLKDQIEAKKAEGISQHFEKVMRVSIGVHAFF